MTDKNKLEERNVLVTGCTGFIGSNLCEELVAQKANVFGLVKEASFATKKLDVLDKISVILGDITDYDLLEHSIKENKIDTIFHLAAQPIVSVAKKFPKKTFEINIGGTCNILEAAKNTKTIEKIIIASTDKAYGSHSQLPYYEDFPLKGEGPYEASKSCSDLIAQSYYKTYKLPIVISRCVNIYGGGDLNFDRIIPGTMLSLYKNQSPVIRSDGLFVRDYMHIKDAINSYITLAQSLPNTAGEAFNFSLNKPVNVIDLVKLIIKITGKEPLVPTILNQPSNEIRKQYLANEKAQKTLNWKPQYDLEPGLKETWNWYTDYFKKNERNIINNKQ